MWETKIPASLGRWMQTGQQERRWAAVPTHLPPQGTPNRTHGEPVHLGSLEACWKGTASVKPLTPDFLTYR